MRARGQGIVVAAVALLCLVALSAGAAEPRHHGLQLDGQHRLLLEQRGAEIVIAVISRTRAEGGAPLPQTRAGGRGELGRSTSREDLARVRIQILAPAPPNYLRNPGARYRIIVEGESVEPGYASMVEVDAIDARDALHRELERLWQRAHGVKRKALWHAASLAASVYTGSNLLPAPMPKSVLKSMSGKRRGFDINLQRRDLKEQSIKEEHAQRLDTPEKMAAVHSGTAGAGGDMTH